MTHIANRHLVAPIKPIVDYTVGMGWAGTNNYYTTYMVNMFSDYSYNTCAGVLIS